MNKLFLHRLNLKELIDDQRKTLKLYAAGAILFFVGFALIIYAQKMLPPSLDQEVCALLGLVSGGLGFGIAMLAQVLLIIGRFRKMGR